ncbi:MAG TPA: hypothetical protein VMM81_03185, partial [Acidimicrobiia bacterium]|nr:hypothetical protein [Acidimicrobiia bacterium]
EEFVDQWRAGVVPLRAEFGFEIIGAWSNPETDRFVWLLAHEGDFEAADRTYYESAGRGRLSPDPARLIEEAHKEFVVPAL